jgi:hypothetical protein
LAKWGYKKNNTREDWKQARILLKEREGQGKDSVITIAGKTISGKKLKKGAYRYRYDPGPCTEDRVGKVFNRSAPVGAQD